ncbi:universal stress protein [Natrinema soli]|uniref:Universal stress protein n=1 Tax=Natrinema soli TaxID=1930624 RepID=A0ABD5SEI4_9EURY|nr:universal stress protein [Natrinema soli]
MPRVERILLPIDESEATANAIAPAIEFAEESDATLHVLAVTDQSSSAERDVMFERFETESQTVADDVTDRAADSRVSSVAISIAVGLPSQVICEYATNRGIDLIVMGTHGRTGIDRVLRRSVCESVVRWSDTPVYVVPIPDRDTTDDR